MTGFKIGNLLFDSFDDYFKFCDLDRNIHLIVKYTESSTTPVKDIFKDVETINVTECCYNAREEMDGLFSNATKLLCFEGTPYQRSYDVGCCFFDKINVVEYKTDDSDSESVSLSLPMSETESESETETETESESDE